MNAPDRGPVLGGLVDGGELRPLHGDDVQLLQGAVRLLASALSRRDGACPANLAVLQGLLDRVVASEAVRSRLPTSAVLGSVGSPEQVAPASVDRMEIRQVAQALGCKERNVRDLVHRGVLPGVKRGGRWQVEALDVAELLADRRVA